MAFQPKQHRGLRLDGAGWVYGLPTYDWQQNLFIQVYTRDEAGGRATAYAVDPESLGQHVGEINDNDAWQGDVFSIEDHGNAVVAWDEEACGFELQSVHGENFKPDDVEAWFIGNIHQQPELMNDPEEQRRRVIGALGTVAQVVEPNFHVLNASNLRSTHALMAAHLHLSSVLGINGELTDSEVQDIVADALAEDIGSDVFCNWTDRMKADLNIDHIGLEEG